MSFLHESIRPFPADVGQTDVTLRAVNVVGQQRSPFSGRREVQVFPGAYWEMEISLIPSVRAEAQRIEAWMLSLRGTAGMFRHGDPYRSLPLGTNLGAPKVLAAQAGEELFTSQGWSADQQGALLSGDFIEIERRLYMLLQDVDADAAGNAEIRVWPPLRRDHAAGVTIITENARGVFALADNAPEFTRNVDQYNGAMIRAIEVIDLPDVFTLGGEEFTVGGNAFSLHR